MIAHVARRSCQAVFPQSGEFLSFLAMRSSLLLAAAALLALGAPLGAQAVSLDEACGRFASKLSAAQAAGDSQKAQTIYQQGSQRIASNFNGATCPNVKPPTP
jgi:hypothetical protein